MSTAITYNEYQNTSNSLSSGIEPFSNQIIEEISNLLNSVESNQSYSAILGKNNEMQQELNELFLECSENDWDGYDANSLIESAYFEAMRFIQSISSIHSFPTPEIVPEPTGEIGFEWYKENRQVFIVSVSGKNELVYAGLFGPNKVHGTEYFGDSLPSIIITNLKRLYT